MFKRTNLMLALGLGLGSFATTLHAQQAITTPLGTLAAEQRGLEHNVLDLEQGQVVAKINDTPLYAENLLVLDQQLQATIPPHRLIERMVELRLIANKARAEKLTQDPILGAEIQNAIDNALASAYLKHFIDELDIDERAIAKAFEEYIDAYPRNHQYKAAHILVDSREQAEQLIEELEAGADFHELAQEHSQDPGSAARGGKLGWFEAEQMVPEFSAGVQALAPGETSPEPVESQFGWHLIALEQTRLTPLPEKQDVREELVNQYQHEAIESMLEQLREQAHIEIVDANFLTEFGEDALGEAGNGATRLPQSPLPALP